MKEALSRIICKQLLYFWVVGTFLWSTSVGGW